ncbi:MAG: hypothetical protein KAT34_20885 [Candidatus Aminicenantes bacterium]|nr:hypothetical protein [Candidatus Aminicenantes bacterium]
MRKKPYLFVLCIVVLFTFTFCGGKSVAYAPPPAQTVQTAQASAGPNTIFFDNFNNRKNEWQQVNGNWIVAQRGFMVQRASDPRMLNCLMYVSHPQAAKFTIETYVRIVPDLPSVITDSAADQALVRNVRYIIGAGIIFRMKDNNNYYMFRLAGEEGAVLGKMVNGVWVDIENPRSIDFLPERVRFSQANWYALKVVCNGDRITCYINDSVVVNKTDTQFSLGRFGLCTFKTRADFDYFKVYE